MPQQQQARRDFDERLDHLQDRLLRMAGLVEEVVDIGVRAILARDPEAVRLVARKDDHVDQLEIEIDELVVELLARDQPMPGISGS